VTETAGVVWLSQKNYDRLRQEYEYLSDVKMGELSRRIAQARDEGDLSENAGYHAARDEQAQLVARLRQLKLQLDQAQVGQADGDAVAPGMTVTVAFGDDPEDRDTFLLGSREIIALDDSLDLPVYSPQSPLGAAVLGKAVGDEAAYLAPNGRTISVTVVSFEPYGG
jgi:transcription elongation factor GreA